MCNEDRENCISESLLRVIWKISKKNSLELVFVLHAKIMYPLLFL